MSQHKWIVNDELVSRKLDENNTLEIKLTEKGLEIKVWEEPEDELHKRKLMCYKSISYGQLGYLIPREN